MFPKDSAFKQEADRIARAEEQKHRVRHVDFDVTIPPDDTRDGSLPVVGKIESLANDDTLYYELDRALSYLDTRAGPVPQGNIRLAAEILERLRDEAYARLR